MITKLLYENKALNILFIIFLALVGNIYQFFLIEDYISTTFINFPLFQLSFRITSEILFLIYQCTALIVAIQISSISKLYSNHFSIFLPSVLWLVLANIYPLYAVTPLNILLLPFTVMLVKLLFDTYEKQNIQSTLFLFGFLLGLAMLINADVLLITPLLYLWLINFRQFNIKDYVIPLVGILVPIILSDAILYVISLNENDSIFTRLFYTFHFKDLHSPLLPFLSSLFLFTFSIYRFINYRHSLKKIKERKYFLWIILSLIYLWIMFIITDNQLAFFSINVLLSLLISILIVSFQNTLYSKLFFIGTLLLNFVSMLIML